MISILYDVLGILTSDVALSDMVSYSVSVVNVSLICVTALIGCICIAIILNLRRR